jgi:hypothetical protein
VKDEEGLKDNMRRLYTCWIAIFHEEGATTGLVIVYDYLLPKERCEFSTVQCLSYF